MPGGDCHGTGADHCCYQVVDGVERVCPFLEMDTEAGRRFSCGLRRELGNWNRVHRDTRYRTQVRPIWDQHGVPDCGAYGPGTGQCCYGRWPNPTAELDPRCKLPPPGRFDERG